MQVFKDMSKAEKGIAAELFNDFLDEMAHVCGYADHDDWEADDWDEFEDIVVDAVRYRR